MFPLKTWCSSALGRLHGSRAVFCHAAPLWHVTTLTRLKSARPSLGLLMSQRLHGDRADGYQRPSFVHGHPFSRRLSSRHNEGPLSAV